MLDGTSIGQNSILPITGTDLRLERDGRMLLDVEAVKVGEPGVTTLLGHNGAGKSLLLKVLTGLMRPDRGQVLWAGAKPDRARYRRLGYMKQNAVLLRRSARANLEFVFAFAGGDVITARNKADATLAEFGLQPVADTSARLLSGGEKQRLALARMLALKPEVILLDEPTASLDPVSTQAIERVVSELKERRLPVFLVTHNLAQAKRLSDDIIFLDQGRILAHQPASAFFSKPACAEVVRFLGD